MIYGYTDPLPLGLVPIFSEASLYCLGLIASFALNEFVNPCSYPIYFLLSLIISIALLVIFIPASFTSSNGMPCIEQ